MLGGGFVVGCVKKNAGEMRIVSVDIPKKRCEDVMIRVASFSVIVVFREEIVDALNLFQLPLEDVVILRE